MNSKDLKCCGNCMNHISESQKCNLNGRLAEGYFYCELWDFDDFPKYYREEQLEIWRMKEDE